MTSAGGEEGFYTSRRSATSVRLREKRGGLISPLEYGSRDLITDERTESTPRRTPRGEFSRESSVCK
jgi:hypothetical protein